MLLAAPLASAQAVDEAGYVREVLASGAASRLLEAERAEETAQLAGLGLWPNPSLEWQRESLGAGTGPNGGSQDNFVVSVPLVLSGRTSLESDSTRAHQQAAELRRQHQQALLLREAVLRFGRAAAAERRVRALTDSANALRDVKQIAAAREKAGEASGYDTVRVTLEVAAVERELTDASIALAHARAEALSLLPADRELSFEPGGETGPSAPSEQQLSADLRALERDIDSAEAAERAAARGFIPDLTLTAGAQVFRLGLDQSNWGYVVGLSLPLPLFQRGQDRLEQARARRLVSQERRALLARELMLRLKAAGEEMNARKAQLERHRADVEKRANELRRIARASYQGGEANLLVLVDAERSWRDAQLAGLDVSLQLKRAELDVALLSGRLQFEGGGVTGR